jgi:uncharacterized membrane protein YfcA
MDPNIIPYILVGFVAQLINCSLGMAFGVLCTSVLLFAGLTPAAASACVHTAELFGTAASGYCHWRLGNVDGKILRALLLPGIIGGAIGACVLTRTPAHIIKPFIAVFLVAMGARIVWNVLRKETVTATEAQAPRLLGLAAGFLDAIGGGGWGSIATSHLVASGHNPRLVIGTVNFSRFFVTSVSSAIFFATFGMVHWQIVLGLAIGAVLAAPVAAPISKRVKPRALAVAVAVLICGLSISSLWQMQSANLLTHQRQHHIAQQGVWK